MGNDAANYAALIDGIFGAGTATFSTHSLEWNNVTRALTSNGYDEFKANFVARLERLKPFAQDPRHWRFVKNALNSIHSVSNWDGAYAELAALDYFITSLKFRPSDMDCDKASSASDTVGSDLGMSNVDHDFYIRSCDAYIDVKILSDKSKQLVEGIVAEALKKLGIKGLRILSFHDVHVSYLDIQANRHALMSELMDALAESAPPATVRSSIIQSLQYQPVWKSGVFMAEGEYNPSDHAERHRVLLFQHAKKFHKARPSFIAFVHFPWASEPIFPVARNVETFFRELALGFFKGYRNSAIEGRRFNTKFSQGLMADDITRHLAGILFLEDKCISGDSSSPSMVDRSVVYNSRYKRKLATICIRTRFRAWFGLEAVSKWKHLVSTEVKAFQRRRRDRGELRCKF